MMQVLYRWMPNLFWTGNGSAAIVQQTVVQSELGGFHHARAETP